MSDPMRLHPDRLLPPEEPVRDIARQLLAGISNLPLISPHGHVPIEWFDPDFRFTDATDLLIRPDHYLLRMLASQGHPYEKLGIAGIGSSDVADSRSAFRTFADGYDFFLGTPSRLWLDHALHEVLGVTETLSTETADQVFDQINARLARPEFTPRALYHRFGMEVLATTDSAVDDLRRHRALADDPDWTGRIVPTFRPDSVTDPEHKDFAQDIAKLGELSGRNIAQWDDYLEALRQRRLEFQACGATATDHGFATPDTISLPKVTCQALLDAALSGTIDAGQSATFRAQMLYEMARMSTEDGLVMQIHAGSWRNYAPQIAGKYGTDKGFDMPMSTDWTRGLKPLLDDFGFDTRLQIVLYTLDETSYGRELAPLAGAFPVLLLGAPWWFYDSPMGMDRHFDAVVETAGFRNLAGFVDDTRALLSIPGRHDVYRRAVASKLARMVAEHQLSLEQAHALAVDLVIGRVRDAYRLT